MKNAYLIKGAAPALQWVQFAELICRQLGTENYSLTAPAQVGDNLRIGGTETTVTAIPEGDDECSGRYMITVDPPVATDPVAPVERQELVNPYAAYSNVVVEQDGQGNAIYDMLAESDPTLVGDTLIGGWDLDGALITPLDLTAYEEIRPLGNSPEQIVRDEQGEPVDVIPPGIATKELKYAHWAAPGLSHRQLDQGGNLYPDSNQPFPGIMGRMYWPEISHPNKHGWQFELAYDFDETLRDPADVFIGVFADADCTTYLYQVGAMYKGESAFQMDEEGNPRTVWLQNNFGTQNTLEPETIHFAICNGHITIHEGRATLDVGEELEQDLYWKEDQPDQGTLGFVTAAWADTGERPWLDITMTGQDKIKVRQALRDAGIPNPQINQSHALQGQKTHKEALILLLIAIQNGVIVLP